MPDRESQLIESEKARFSFSRWWVIGLLVTFVCSAFVAYLYYTQALTLSWDASCAPCAIHNVSVCDECTIGELECASYCPICPTCPEVTSCPTCATCAICNETAPCECNGITKPVSADKWQLRDTSICKTVGMQPVIDDVMYAPLVAVNEACPRYIYAPICTVAGLGHRIQNWMAAHTLSIALNFSVVYGGGFCNIGNHHDSYPEAETIFGTSLFPQLSEVRSRHPNTRTHELKGYSTGRNWAELVELYMSEINAELAIQPCHVIFQFNEGAWPDHYTEARQYIRASYFNAFSCKPSRFNPDHLAITVHLRYGAVNAPDGSVGSFISSSWYVAICTQLVVELQRTGAKNFYHFYLFTVGEAFSDLLSALPKGRYTLFEKQDASAVDTLQHLVTSDITVCGGSSLCNSATIGSVRPLVLMAPSKEPFTFTPCEHSVMVPSSGVMEETTGIARLRVAIDHWLILHGAGCNMRKNPEWC